MYKKILRQPVEFPESVPISEEAKDLIRKLLIKNPKQRLGSQGEGDEILKHEWFKNIDWKAIESLNYEPPYKPKI